VNYLEQMNTKIKENDMNLVNSVFEIAKSFMKNPKYVNINIKKLDQLADKLKDTTPPIFPAYSTEDVYTTCIIELVASALNYCYWYGKSDIRPLYSSSGKLKDVIINSFMNFSKTGGKNSFDSCLNNLIESISVERFPLLEERILHINELRDSGQPFIQSIVTREYSLEQYLEDMLRLFPGFASDLFLKRTVLFFAQLNRLFDWFERDMRHLPIPADYQVPKMLEAENILIYHPDLIDTINKEILIPKGSLYECEIRAASILACDRLVHKTDWTMPQIDGYFWLRRKDVTTPFHLTVTTDY
jgi:hypothetical protein